MTTAIICAAILAALLFLLGLNVSRLRSETLKTDGPQYPTDPTNRLFKAIRAHGNTAEYVPTLIVLFLLVGARSPLWVAIPLIIGATAARMTHAYGMLATPNLATKTPARFVGSLGTYVFGVGLAVAAVFSL